MEAEFFSFNVDFPEIKTTKGDVKESKRRKNELLQNIFPVRFFFFIQYNENRTQSFQNYLFPGVIKKMESFEKNRIKKR